MRIDVRGWLSAIRQDVRRQGLASDLGRLSDYLLDDIGLRRDQLDLLRLREPQVRRGPASPAPRYVERPSMHGCG